MAKPVTLLRRARRASRWTLTQVADHLGISVARLCEAELQRERALTLPSLLQMCQFIGTDPVPIVIEARRVEDYVLDRLANHIRQNPELTIRLADHIGSLNSSSIAAMLTPPPEPSNE